MFYKIKYKNVSILLGFVSFLKVESVYINKLSATLDITL